MSNHIAICEPVGQANLNIDESYRPTELPQAQPSAELPKVQPSAELPKAQPFCDKFFKNEGIKYKVTA